MQGFRTMKVTNVNMLHSDHSSRACICNLCITHQAWFFFFFFFERGARCFQFCKQPCNVLPRCCKQGCLVCFCRLHLLSLKKYIIQQGKRMAQALYNIKPHTLPVRLELSGAEKIQTLDTKTREGARYKRFLRLVLVIASPCTQQKH